MNVSQITAVSPIRVVQTPLPYWTIDFEVFRGASIILVEMQLDREQETTFIQAMALWGREYKAEVRRLIVINSLRDLIDGPLRNTMRSEDKICHSIKTTLSQAQCELRRWGILGDRLDTN